VALIRARESERDDRLLFDPYARAFGDAVEAGLTQVALLGAGLDTRAFRLGLPAAVRVFEVDVPEMVSFKEPILRELGAEPTCGRTTGSSRSSSARRPSRCAASGPTPRPGCARSDGPRSSALRTTSPRHSAAPSRRVIRTRG
jgi:hypothetical protein